EIVQVLDFAVVGAALATPQLAGTVLDASVSRYPGSSPRRALFREGPARVDVTVSRPEAEDTDAAYAASSRRLARSAWTDRVPVVLGPVTVCPAAPDRPAGVVDAQARWLELVEEAPVWTLLALSAGRPVDLFGELEDGRVRPLSVVVGDRVVPL